MAVTDHDTVKGALEALRVNPYPDFFIIPGIEVKSDLGDIIGLYVTREIQSRKFGEVIDEIHAQGGIAYLPHPVRTFGAQRVPGIHAAYPAIDLWELYNGRYEPSHFQKSRELFQQLAIEGKLCGSDAHFPWEIGIFRTTFSAVPREPQALMELSRGARLHATPRADVPLQIGITLGTMIKAVKRKQYRKFGGMIAELPFRTVKRLFKARRRAA